MGNELITNKMTTTVSSGGTTAPAALTSESWTVAASSGWPAAVTSQSQFRVVDIADTLMPPEIMLVTNVASTTWTVTRGYEGATPWGHTSGFTVMPILSAGGFANYLNTAPLLDATANNDLLAWAFDPAATQASAALTAANISLSRIPLPRSISITNAVAYLGLKAGSTVTHCFLALFKSDGTIIGQTADQSADWGSGGASGVKTLALTGGPFTLIPLAANDFVWGAFYCGTSVSTPPSFLKSSSPAAGGASVGTTASRTRFGIIAQADTATLASITPSSISQSNGYWMGLN